MGERPNSNAGKRVPCERCAKPCIVAPTRNESAKMAVEANGVGVCGECIITGMIKGLTGKDDRRPDDRRAQDFPAFTADSLRLPHIQAQIEAVIRASGSSLAGKPFDWDEIIANWHLPLPKSASGGLYW